MRRYQFIIVPDPKEITETIEHVYGHVPRERWEPPSFMYYKNIQEISPSMMVIIHRNTYKYAIYVNTLCLYIYLYNIVIMNTGHDIIFLILSAYIFTSGVAGRRQMSSDYICSNFMLCIVLLLLCTVLSLLQE